MNFKYYFRHFWLAIGLFLGSAGLDAWADPATDSGSVTQPLTRAYYEFIVAGYCGLVDRPVEIGFLLLRHDLLARGNLTPADHQMAAHEAYLAADFEYQDRGLSGQKRWCRTDGADYASRFVQYFQRRELP